MKRMRDYGVIIGDAPCGPTNTITDVAGVTVGHVTLSNGPVQTGVTAILPHAGNLYQNKVAAGCHVVNGYGKSIGLMQIDEVGTIETPLVLTNTLCVGRAYTAVVRHMLDANPDIGALTGTVNPIILECNDGVGLNDVRGLHVEEAHVLEAIGAARADFAEGSIGAGTGMRCYGLRSGIGSASRMVGDYTVGALTLGNMGRRKDFRLDGKPVGRAIAARHKADMDTSDKGSIIVVLATDAPLSDRQLRRLAVRGGAGIARSGTQFGSGSGDIIVAFSSTQTIPHYAPDTGPEVMFKGFAEPAIDPFFAAAIEATEEAILNALIAAVPGVGYGGRRLRALSEFQDLWV